MPTTRRPNRLTITNPTADSPLTRPTPASATPPPGQQSAAVAPARSQPSEATPPAGKPAAGITSPHSEPPPHAASLSDELSHPVEPPPPAPPNWWRAPGASPVVLIACAAAGLFCAIAIPLDRPGIGWLFGGLAVTAATAFVARITDRTRSVRLVRLGWTLLALALLAVGAFRSAGWLFTLCVIAACVAGSLAVAGGTTAGQVLLGSVAVPLSAVRSLPWVAIGVAALPRGGRSRSARLAVAVIVGVALVGVFGALFAGADATFAKVLSALVPNVQGGSTFQGVLVFGTVGLGTAGAARLLLDRRTTLADPLHRRTTVRRLEWAVPVGALVLLFAAFVADQVAVLFGGAGYVRRTVGLTYAQYARSGFWELLTVTGLTLVVISVAARIAPRNTAADRAWLRGLLGALAVLTLVIVASALSRMWSYQQAYGFTVLRLNVEVCELWLGLVYVLIIVAGWRTRLARTIMASGLAALFVLAVVNPERLVAAENVVRWQQTGKIDLHYLGGLSTDAIAGLTDLPSRLRDPVVARIRVG